MKKLTLKNLMVYELIFIFLLGSLMHFIYDWFPNPITALFSPVSESSWEHLKLFILPMIIVAFFEFRYIKNINLILWTKLVQFAFMALFIITFFYNYTGVFGVRAVLMVDICSFLSAICIGQIISYRIFISKKKPPVKTSTIAAILFLIFIGFINFSYNVPSIPIFQNQESTSRLPK